MSEVLIRIDVGQGRAAKMAVGAKTRGRRAGTASSLMVKRPGARRTGDADLPIAHWRLALRLVKVSARRLAGSGCPWRGRRESDLHGSM